MKRLTENQKLYLETINTLEDELLTGQITDEAFNNNMENLKMQGKQTLLDKTLEKWDMPQ